MSWEYLEEDIAEEFVSAPVEQMALEFAQQLPLRFRSELDEDDDLAHLPRHLRLRAEGKSLAEIASYMGWTKAETRHAIERDQAQLTLSDLWLIRSAPLAKRGASAGRYPAKQSRKRAAATRRRAWRAEMDARSTARASGRLTKV